MALPFAEPCRGTLLPSGRTMRTGLDVSRRSIRTARGPSGTIRCTVSPVSVRSRSMAPIAASRTLFSSRASRPIRRARLVRIQRVTSPGAGRIHPAAPRVRSARWTELFGRPSVRDSSPTPAGWWSATPSSTRSAILTLRIPSASGTVARHPSSLRPPPAASCLRRDPPGVPTSRMYSHAAPGPGGYRSARSGPPLSSHICAAGLTQAPWTAGSA